jgi:putative redox protein
VATLAAPADPAHLTHLLQGSLEEIQKTGEAQVLLAGRPFTIKKQFLDDLAENNMQDILRKLRRALMVMHSPVDATVEIDNAAKIFTAALHPKSFVSLDKADHLLSNERDARYAGSILATWALQHVETLPQEDHSLEGAQVLVRAEDSYRSEIRTSGHTLLADEPTSLGGTDTGPNPYEYLLAALGACTTITTRMYANRKKLPMEAINVRLAHQRVHARDCEDCDSDSGQVDIIDRELEIIGPDLTAEQRESIRGIADKCPVHRTLHTETRVRTTLKT